MPESPTKFCRASSPKASEPPRPPPLPPPPPFRRLPTENEAGPAKATAALKQEAPFEPMYYFFYGTLMKPDILKAVLGPETTPLLRTAKVYGFELANWGQYRALIDSTPEAAVTGCAYMVQSAEEAYKLAYYETNAYALTICKIHFIHAEGQKEDEAVHGKTFKYAGDGQALKEGRFDRTLWELRMGHKLPRKWHKGEKQVKEEGGASG
ncbi:uncharacterized protein B0T15DRAFT_515617 [Chaetomium strumarium]|uniref:Putative gamma-glutamylcyclotransferase n=1 Tax=Chaetomium strumarium TaxID=1170767 RepID=A0AAJ0H101_9PEZI|nr:hypothetical protein B0T15DRAFT_515617 [Chaetomium strumarium]